MIWWFLFGVLVGVSLATVSFVVGALWPFRKRNRHLAWKLR